MGSVSGIHAAAGEDQSPPPGAGLRLALVADGRPDDRHTNSGVALGMLEALRADPGVASVLPIDASFHRSAKALVALLSVKPSRTGWRVNYSHGRFAVRMRSLLVTEQVERHRAEVDLVLLIRGHYQPFDFPYANFVDSTEALNRTLWPPLAVGDHAASIADDRAQLSSAVHVFTAGAHVAEHVIADYHIPRERVTAIGGGLNYSLAEIAEWSPLPQPTILFVGHDFERKGGDLLCQAFGRVRSAIPEARLLLVGRGSHVAGAQPGVTVLGDVDDRHTLSELYRTATVFCLPARFEPFGLVLLEAMAHGLPCVAANVGEIPQIFQQGALGVLVEAGDVAGLADALIALILDPERQRMLSAAGRREVTANGTWNLVARRLLERLPADLR